MRTSLLPFAAGAMAATGARALLTRLLRWRFDRDVRAPNAGEHRGKAAIEPWATTVVLRFDDRATAPGGELLVREPTVPIVHARWGRVVRHEDFYEDTGRIEALDARLRELGIDPVAG